MSVTGVTSLANTGVSMSSSYFTGADPSGGDRLQAAVFWRTWRRAEPQRIRWPFLHFAIGLLLVRTRILPFLWRRGFQAWMFGSFRDADEVEKDMMRRPHSPDAHWTASTGIGEFKVSLDGRRGVVRVRTREFGPAPAGHALLLLIEDDPTAPDGIAVVERTVPAAPLPPKPELDRSGSKRDIAMRLSAAHREQQRGLSAIVEADPEYQRFMARGSTSAGSRDRHPGPRPPTA